MSQIMEKLVRDRIPEIMRKAGLVPTFRSASGSERLPLLVAKLREETNEFDAEFSVAELADILEVVLAIRDELGVNEDDLTAILMEKKATRGSFRDGIVLKLD